ncbi:LuxR C-terminal-related transcriptional regulator [Phocaeicola vulgatus]|uniref:response regulator transcription factor n=1 Tax=Bacteroidaceae TaxID=815 RepID=UPI001F26502F|nr:LuxR C-terminal-related transcriptional regulator [Phocaeicola vulgatus]MCE8957504.1 LuxR C-terminal-related transcriptional regulator [Phocaeicola vulgatus]
MMEVKDFFIKDNIIDKISDEAYNDIAAIIEDIDTFARTTYRSVYVIDYYKQNFLYVSENPLFLCGMDANEVRQLGYRFYLNQVPPEDLRLLLEANAAGFQFINNISAKEKKNYSILYDFHIVNRISKKQQLINHQITPLRLAENGQVWLGLCTAAMSSGNRFGELIMLKYKSKQFWKYNRLNRKWTEMDRPELKEMEKEVLKLSAMGYTMNEIADKINRSFDTVKSYRRTLLEKLEVANISEAISFAINYRLI